MAATSFRQPIESQSVTERNAEDMILAVRLRPETGVRPWTLNGRGGLQPSAMFGLPADFDGARRNLRDAQRRGTPIQRIGAGCDLVAVVDTVAVGVRSIRIGAAADFGRIGQAVTVGVFIWRDELVLPRGTCEGQAVHVTDHTAVYRHDDLERGGGRRRATSASEACAARDGNSK